MFVTEEERLNEYKKKIREWFKNIQEEIKTKEHQTLTPIEYFEEENFTIVFEGKRYPIFPVGPLKIIYYEISAMEKVLGFSYKEKQKIQNEIKKEFQ